MRVRIYRLIDGQPDACPVDLSECVTAPAELEAALAALQHEGVYDRGDGTLLRRVDYQG